VRNIKGDQKGRKHTLGNEARVMEIRGYGATKLLKRKKKARRRASWQEDSHWGGRGRKKKKVVPCPEWKKAELPARTKAPNGSSELGGVGKRTHALTWGNNVLSSALDRNIINKREAVEDWTEL